MTDEELVNLVKKGEIDSFKPLVVKYSPHVRRVITRIVKNSSDVDDLLSKVFMKAYDNLSSYSSSHAFSTWLLNIAKNLAIDFLRQKRRTIQISDVVSNEEDISIQVADTESSIEEQIISNENTNSLQQMIDLLSQKEQHLLYLKYHENKTYEEISQELNLSISSIKTTLYRARQHLRELIQSNKNLSQK